MSCGTVVKPLVQGPRFFHLLVPRNNLFLSVGGGFTFSVIVAYIWNLHSNLELFLSYIYDICIRIYVMYCECMGETIQ